MRSSEYYHAIGSIEGRIELVPDHHGHGHRWVNITDDQMYSIRCNFPFEMSESVFKAIFQKCRVVVSGTIKYNAQNERVSIRVKPPLRFLGLEADLPTSSELGGSDPHFTGDLSTEEFVRRIRE